MGLETGTYISDLVSTNPTATDPKSAGDDHIRLLKSTVKATFPNVSGAVTPTHTELNYVDGVTSAIQTQLDAKQPLDADLTALAGLSSNGVIARTGAGTVAARTITAPAAGITVTDGDGVSGNPTLALANDLAALEGLSSTGVIVRTGDGTATTRTITAGSGVSVSNGDGVSGNPTISVTPGVGLGDVLGQSSSVDGEIALFSGTGGKTIKRATTTGILKAASGVVSAASDGSDYLSSATGIKQGKHTISIPAGAMTARTTSGAAAGTAETSTNKVMLKTLDFDQSTDEFAQFVIPMPKSWDEGTVTAQFLWSSAVSSTDSVVWGCQAVALSDDDALDAAFGTAQTVTDAQTASGDLMITAETSAITIGGTPAVGDLVVFQVYRDADNGSDTLAGDARLHAVRIYYTINAADDT